jgi:aryl-alcohol dehydrogenase-like predicted oxidoreductase
VLTRRFGRLGWQVSEVGYGMWAIGGGENGWTGAGEDEKWNALNRAVELGCNFFDTAWIYGRGHSERLLGDLLRSHPDKRLYVATKIPPKDRAWPSTRDSRLTDVFPADHIKEYVERSRENLRVKTIDLLQFHVWEDSWADDDRWQRVIADLRDQGIVSGVGISINRWEPWNALAALRTGLIDAVQVCYNIFDQSPEDELLPAAESMDIAVIARVPFDEGSLTGTLTAESSWPEGDWRNSYFVPENLIASVERAERLRRTLPTEMSMPEAALRFILAHRGIATVIPGMRSVRNVEANLGVSDGISLKPSELETLRNHRWDRTPTVWSQ